MSDDVAVAAVARLLWEHGATPRKRRQGWDQRCDIHSAFTALAHKVIGPLTGGEPPPEGPSTDRKALHGALAGAGYYEIAEAYRDESPGVVGHVVVGRKKQGPAAWIEWPAGNINGTPMAILQGVCDRKNEDYQGLDDRIFTVEPVGALSAHTGREVTE